MLNDLPNRTEQDVVNLDLTAKACFSTTLHRQRTNRGNQSGLTPKLWAVMKKQPSKGLKAGLLQWSVVKTSPSKAGGVGSIHQGGVGGPRAYMPQGQK